MRAGSRCKLACLVPDGHLIECIPIQSLCLVCRFQTPHITSSQQACSQAGLQSPPSGALVQNLPTRRPKPRLSELLQPSPSDFNLRLRLKQIRHLEPHSQSLVLPGQTPSSQLLIPTKPRQDQPGPDPQQDFHRIEPLMQEATAVQLIHRVNIGLLRQKPSRRPAGLQKS